MTFMAFCGINSMNHTLLGLASVVFERYVNGADTREEVRCDNMMHSAKYTKRAGSVFISVSSNAKLGDFCLTKEKFADPDDYYKAGVIGISRYDAYAPIGAVKLWVHKVDREATEGLRRATFFGETPGFKWSFHSRNLERFSFPEEFSAERREIEDIIFQNSKKTLR